MARAPRRELSSGSRGWDLLTGLISWLAGRSSLALFGGFLVWFAAWSVGAHLLLGAIIEEHHHDALTRVTGPLMPAVGTLFAFLTAFVITNQWNRSRDAERTVGEEADAFVRLALAAQTPGLASARVHRLQAGYLTSVLRHE